MKLNKVERRRLILFFVCFAVAIVAWFFFALSAQYKFLVRKPVHYTSIPLNKACHPLQMDSISLYMQSSGWQILFSKMQITAKAIDIDLKDLEKQNYTVLTKQIPYIKNQLDDDQKIIAIKPDTLFFDFRKHFTKKVPVKLLEKITFTPRYNIAEKILIQPAYVTITGSISDLENIDVWLTDTLALKNINNSIQTKLELSRQAKATIHVEPNVVDVTIPVDEFTEKSVKVPLKVLNNFTFEDIKLLPTKVTITFLTALNNYEKIDASFFEAIVDLNQWRKNNYRQLPVVIKRFPNYCKLVRIEPQFIDFIINK